MGFPRKEYWSAGILPVAVTMKETVTPVKVEEKYDEKSAEIAKMVRSLYRASWIWHPVNPRAEGKVTFRAAIDT